jgi:tRNA threonylcarbamoyladenosine biosynthesis protein TsaB
MLILAVETSGKNGGVALARGDAKKFELLGEAPIGTGQYSAELMPRIVELLERARVSKSDVDGFAVASGPGSFTGLRVGIATVKALADTLQKPLAAVSVLEAIAQRAREAQLEIAANDPEARERKLQREHTVALLDAGRGEVYVGIYIIDQFAHGKHGQRGEVRRIVRELLLPFDDLLQNLPQLAPQPLAIATPDEKIAELLREQNVSVIAVERPGARDIARLGIEKLARGEAAPVAELDANYIRRSDAEIFSLPKLQK